MQKSDFVFKIDVCKWVCRGIIKGCKFFDSLCDTADA